LHGSRNPDIDLGSFFKGKEFPVGRDFRMIDSNGARIPFTCENRAFTTNIAKGHSHGPLLAQLGSVFDRPLIHASSGYSLWLEHVLEKDNRDEMYWLMWYDPDGMPSIPLSGVFTNSDLQQMVSLLAGLIA
jgi:hypothetical protein